MLIRHIMTRSPMSIQSDQQRLIEGVAHRLQRLLFSPEPSELRCDSDSAYFECVDCARGVVSSDGEPAPGVVVPKCASDRGKPWSVSGLHGSRGPYGTGPDFLECHKERPDRTP